MNKKQECINRVRAVLVFAEDERCPHPNAPQMRWLLAEIAMILGDNTIAPVAGQVYDTAAQSWSMPPKEK